MDKTADEVEKSVCPKNGRINSTCCWRIVHLPAMRAAMKSY